MRVLIDLSNSTRAAVQACDACATHNRPHIEIHTTDSDQPAVQRKCNVPSKAFLDLYSSMHQRNEY